MQKHKQFFRLKNRYFGDALITGVNRFENKY